MFILWFTILIELEEGSLNYFELGSSYLSVYMDVRLGPKLPQIRPKWDTSGPFKDEFRYILAR